MTILEKINNLTWFDFLKKIKEILLGITGSVFIDAPNDNKIYGRKNLTWSEVLLNSVNITQSGIVDNTSLQELGGKDKLINGVRVGRGNSDVLTNTALGRNVLTNNTVGSSNTGVGRNSLFTNIIGSFNTGVGAYALFSSQSSNNTAIGSASLLSLTNGQSNTAIGSGALYFSTSGSQNTSVGVASMQNNTTGSENTVHGFQAGGNITTGARNVVIGSQGSVVTGISSGNDNILLGKSDNGITTGSGNVIIGKPLGLASNLSNNIIIADGVGNQRINIDSNGNIGIGTSSPTSKLQVVGLPIFTNNASAISGGLTLGAFYHNGDGIVRVVF